MLKLFTTICAYHTPENCIRKEITTRMGISSKTNNLNHPPSPPPLQRKEEDIQTNRSVIPALTSYSPPSNLILYKKGESF